MRRLPACSWLLLLLGSCHEKSQDAWLLVLANPGDGIRLADLHVTPASAVAERHVERDHVALRLTGLGGPLVVRAPGACALELLPGALSPARPHERRLEPLFELGPAARVVGLGQAFTIRAVPRCAEAEALRLELSATGGAALDFAESRDQGRLFAGRTRGAEALTARPSFGIVPVSARASRTTELTARVTLSDGTVLERHLEVTALTRASGLPNVALDHALLLAGDGLRLSARPEGSLAKLRVVGELSELVPDLRGAYTVRGANGRELFVNAGRYDETPLDCGRSDCHRDISQSAANNPMQHVLAEDLGGRHPLTRPDCALACHATGEPGLADGGFVHALSELAGGEALPERFSDLPRALRRLGGVTCLACHGPGSVPEASARWAVLRSDVCAVCHDAPPRYGHIAALAESAMSHADSDPRTRADASCARCHTTYGALGRSERQAPLEAGTLGITCAACHDVHPHPGGTSAVPALLRETPLPALLASLGGAAHGPSRVCLGCHAPDGERPAASAAAIWAGRGGVEPLTGAPLEGPAPHAGESRGCVGCHDAGPESLALGGGHAFHTVSTTCSRCHTTLPSRTDLATRARSLFAALAPMPTRRKSAAGPPHAEPLDAALDPTASRALRDVLLVLEDPAADVHNPRYAALLLDRAEAAVARTRRGGAVPHAGAAP